MLKLAREESKNRTFKLWVGERPDGSLGWTHDTIQSALLMDIRDELQQLNKLLACPRFLGIPSTLKTISRKMPVRRKAKKG